MRKRTIEARVERLWALTGYRRKYPKRGRLYAYRWHPNHHYILTHTDGLLRWLDNVAAEPADAIRKHGWLWGDAHEYAHGWDVGQNHNGLSLGLGFADALATDGHSVTRPMFEALTGQNKEEVFADAIAYTIVNDRTFIKEHPAKYAYARTLLKESGVI